MDLFEVMRKDMKEGMKGKEKVKVESLGNVKKLLVEGKRGGGGKESLRDEGGLKMMEKVVKEGKD